MQAARLGDTLDIWTAAYGAPAGDTVYMKRFNNGTVTVIVFKEHIVNITLSDPAGPSKAPPDYKDFIPEDSILQNTKEEQDEKGSYKTEMYTSFSLEKAFPLSEGKFAVVTAQSRTDGKYLATVIDISAFYYGSLLMPFQQATKNRFLQFDIKVTTESGLLCIKITNRAGSRSLGIIIRLPF